MRALPAVLLGFAFVACSHAPASSSLAGNWDAYLANGSTPHNGFEGWRRMGFAQFHLANDSLQGSIRRRTGEPIVDSARAEMRGDTVVLTGARHQSVVATWAGDTLVGVLMSNGKPAGRRVRLVRR